MYIFLLLLSFSAQALERQVSDLAFIPKKSDWLLEARIYGSRDKLVVYQVDSDAMSTDARYTGNSIGFDYGVGISDSFYLGLGFDYLMNRRLVAETSSGSEFKGKFSGISDLYLESDLRIFEGEKWFGQLHISYAPKIEDAEQSSSDASGNYELDGNGSRGGDLIQADLILGRKSENYEYAITLGADLWGEVTEQDQASGETDIIEATTDLELNFSYQYTFTNRIHVGFLLGGMSFGDREVNDGNAFEYNQGYRAKLWLAESFYPRKYGRLSVEFFGRDRIINNLGAGSNDGSYSEVRFKYIYRILY